MEILNGLAILVAGLMVGVNSPFAVFFHPTLYKLPDDLHLSGYGNPQLVFRAAFMPFYSRLLAHGGRCRS